MDVKAASLVNNDEWWYLLIVMDIIIMGGILWEEWNIKKKCIESWKQMQNLEFIPCLEAAGCYYFLNKSRF